MCDLQPSGRVRARSWILIDRRSSEVWQSRLWGLLSVRPQPAVWSSWRGVILLTGSSASGGYAKSAPSRGQVRAARSAQSMARELSPMAFTSPMS